MDTLYFCVLLFFKKVVEIVAKKKPSVFFLCYSELTLKFKVIKFLLNIDLVKLLKKCFALQNSIDTSELPGYYCLTKHLLRKEFINTRIEARVFGYLSSELKI